MNLRTLTDEELLLFADNADDALTTTPLERELRARLTQALEDARELTPYTDLITEHEPFTPGELAELCDALPEGGVHDLLKHAALLHGEGIDSPDELKTLLDIGSRLRAITDDPAAALDALETLFNTATA